jgi:hypothetical protein
MRTSSYRGRSSAWFGAETLHRFAQQMRACPIEPAHTPILQGGYWSPEGGRLNEAHVRIRVSPLNRRGSVGVEVRLASPSEDPHQFQVSLEFVTRLRQPGPIR